MRSTAVAAAALALGWSGTSLGASITVPTIPTGPSTVTQVAAALPALPAVPQVPAVPDVVPTLPSVPEVVDTVTGTVGGVVSGGSGGGDSTGGPGGAATTRPTTTTTPSSTRTPSGGSAPADPAPATASPGGARSTQPAAAATNRTPQADKAQPAAATTTAAPDARPVTIDEGVQDLAPAERRRTPDIITRIIEVIPPWAKMLIGVLVAIVIGLAVGTHRRLRRRAAEHRHQALHDALTGLANRTLLRNRVTEALLVADRDGGQVAVMLIDLDGFKEVNDTLGHTNGDLLLQQVASRLTGSIRSLDTVSRLGGDEFAVLIPTVPSEDAATTIARTLRHALQEPFTVVDLSIHSDASVGIALSPQHGDDADTLIQHADVAMYLAKHGRAGTVVYDAERDHYSPERLTLIGELRRAIESDEIGRAHV